MKKTILLVVLLTLVAFVFPLSIENCTFWKLLDSLPYLAFFRDDTLFIKVGPRMVHFFLQIEVQA